ncbi:MAG: ABC transporter ATP-binding protein [Sedimentisphaerales bacterium]|nr:ABC transporter ATP-binding protein [Sedimentisphaerales bacterium]
MEVKVVNLKKYFKKTKAVDDISFDLLSGQITAFVGPNGAGKTTAMRIMATIDEPDQGDVLIDGISAIQYPEKVRKLVGFMPDFLPTHPDMTVDDYLDFFARAFGIRDYEKRKKIVRQTEEFTNLITIKDKFLKALSKGMKQRVSLARAIIHDPPVLILDEPAAGLDPRARVELRESLKALAKKGKIIFVSSHILSELAEICDTVVIIEKGKLLKAGGIQQISRENMHLSVMIRSTSDLQKLAQALQKMPQIKDAKVMPNCVAAEIKGSEAESGKILAALVKDGFEIIEIKHVKTSLEDIFMNITKGELA